MILSLQLNKHTWDSVYKNENQTKTGKILTVAKLEAALFKLIIQLQYNN